MQKTIKKSVRVFGPMITGKGTVSITFRPAPPDTGVVFIREDLPGHPEISCSSEYAVVNTRWTSLVKDDIRIEHTEHLLAAIAGLGLDNLRVHLDSPYIPLVSHSSSLGFVKALLEAEPTTQKKDKDYYCIREPQWVIDSFFDENLRYDSILLALPAQELSLTYVLDYPRKQLPTQLANFSFSTQNSFISDIASARSYILEDEYDQAIQLFSQNVHDLLVFPRHSANLKWPNEPARHKLLDMLGDLFTLGKALKGHFIGIRTGHKANIQMCHKLIKTKTFI